MGIFRDLVSNVANARMQEERQKLQYNLGLGDILTTLIQNPDTDPATFAKASSYYNELLGKHGGKEGKALQVQIGQLLQGYGAARAKDRAQGVEGQPSALPPGQTPGQPGGVNYGWPTQATPGTLADIGGAAGGQAAPPAPAQRGGFGRVLGGLAGVGKEMLGIPRQQGGMIIPTSEQIARVYGPTELGLAKEKERGAIAAGQLDRQEFVRQQKADEAEGIQSAADTAENIRDFDRGMGRLAARPPAAEAQTLTTVETKDGQIRPAWQSKRTQAFKFLDGTPVDPGTIRSVGTPIDPKMTGRLKERADIEEILANKDKHTSEQVAAAESEKLYMDTQQESAASLAQIRARQQQSAAAIVSGTGEFQIAQDLAYGRLTFEGFRSLVSYRDTDRRESIYVKATQLNPQFNQAEFESGFRFFARPQTRQQLGAIDNVQAATDDMIRFSDAARRAGNPLMNRFALPAGYLLGSRSYANFQTALTAYADELSGALGFGSATDMTRQLGIKMSDANVDPETFASNLQIVQGFLDRKRNGLLGEMSVYGQPGGTVPEIQTMDQYNALPPGSKWRKPSDPPGTERTKPRR